MKKIEDRGFLAANELNSFIDDFADGVVDMGMFKKFEDGAAKEMCSLVKDELSVPRYFAATLYGAIVRLRDEAEYLPEKREKMISVADSLHSILKEYLNDDIA